MAVNIAFTNVVDLDYTITTKGGPGVQDIVDFGFGPQRIYMRAWDTGTSGFVQWSATLSNYLATPSSAQTTPNYTGTLQNPHEIARV